MKYLLIYAVAALLLIAGFAKHYYILVAIALLIVLPLIRGHVRMLRDLKRAEFIRSYVFPRGLFDKLGERRPELQVKDMSLVTKGLRQYFLVYLASRRNYVSMPSQVVDDLWHEFILHTKSYEQFCKQAFGHFFHHTPAAALSAAQSSGNAGLRRCWWYACKDENINPRKPLRLPLLFALDSKLKIAGGFAYAANCDGLRESGRTHIYCGGDFSDSSFDGSTSGFGDSDSSGSHGAHGCGGGHGGDSGDSGGDGGGGDGGSGCGGGGCGGGGD